VAQNSLLCRAPVCCFAFKPDFLAEVELEELGGRRMPGIGRAYTAIIYTAPLSGSYRTPNTHMWLITQPQSQRRA
jgi:hypothetical protein